MLDKKSPFSLLQHFWLVIGVYSAPNYANNFFIPKKCLLHSLDLFWRWFLSFYALDCIFHFFHISFVDCCLWLRPVTEDLAPSSPTIFPLPSILRDPEDPCSVIFSHWSLQSKWQTHKRALISPQNTLFCQSRLNLLSYYADIGLLYIFPSRGGWIWRIAVPSGIAQGTRWAPVQPVTRRPCLTPLPDPNMSIHIKL